MVSNNFKIAWRSMAKNKLYSFIKIGGFAFSIAICILIVLFIKSETSYNKFYPDMDRTYRLVVQLPIEGKIQRWVSLSAPVAPTLKAEDSHDRTVGARASQSFIRRGQQSAVPQ